MSWPNPYIMAIVQFKSCSDCVMNTCFWDQPKQTFSSQVYFNIDITPMDCPSKSIMKTLCPPWLYLVVHQWLFCPTKVFLGKWTNFLKFLTSCLAKGDYAPSFPTEKFGQNGENYSPLHYLNHNRYYSGGGGRMLRTTIFHHTSIVMHQFSEIVLYFFRQITQHS